MKIIKLNLKIYNINKKIILIKRILRETFNKKLLKKNLFLNIALLKKNVLRGFHFQHKFQQAKYVMF